ncbi:MAG: hypothetical protein KDA24_15370 [Deltaproteobacteria bacterium]|nr:hypothetical protein [Deltaproteobacteria bacterium]
MLVALGLAPVLLGAGFIVPPMLEDGASLVRYVPAIPAVLLLVFASGVHDLFAAGPAPATRLWARTALLFAVAACVVSALFAGLTVFRPEGEWELLAAPRAPLALLAAWATAERLDQVSRAVAGRPKADTWLEDAASLSLLLGLPLALRQLIPGVPTGQELLGGLARPLGLLLLAGVIFGVARLASLALAVARIGAERDL